MSVPALSGGYLISSGLAWRFGRDGQFPRRAGGDPPGSAFQTGGLPPDQVEERPSRQGAPALQVPVPFLVVKEAKLLFGMAPRRPEFAQELPRVFAALRG